MNQTYILKGARLSFSKNLIEPKSTNGGKPRYSANFIIDLTSPEGKAQKKELEKIIADIVKTEFPGRTIENNDLFFRDGNKLIDDKTGEPYTGYAGNAFISGARSEKKGAPRVVGHDPNVKVAPMDDQFPEAGDKVNAKLNFFTINGKNDRGGDASHGKKVCCEIETVQFVRKGEPLAGSSKPTSDGLDAIEDEPVGALSDDEM